MKESVRHRDTCYKQFHDVKADNAETFYTCNTLTAPVKPPMTRQAQAVPSITPMGFKPQSDLKPTFLIQDCTLPEFNQFSETFVTYMRSSGSNVPAEAIYSNLRVHMDNYWFTELIGVGLTTETDLSSFARLMDEVSLVKFPLQNRRMTVFLCQADWGRPGIPERVN